jgi:ribosome-binding protein aMBF1 (putative translation factor)
MITNHRQYRITQGWVRKFEQSLAGLDDAEAHRSPEMRQVMRAAMESQIEDLRSQLAEYDALRQGRVRVLELEGLEALPEALIKARIASGLTQHALAERLGLKEQQIQRYEATRYDGVSLSRIRAVADALGMRVEERVTLPTSAETDV